MWRVGGIDHGYDCRVVDLVEPRRLELALQLEIKVSSDIDVPSQPTFLEHELW